MSEYFELWDDMEVPRRWMLDDTYVGGRWINPDMFTSAGNPPKVEGPILVKLSTDGRILDYTMAGRGMPVASEEAAKVFATNAPNDVQLIPVTVEGHRDQPFFIVHALNAIECVDEARSGGIQRWAEADGRPDRIGDYSAIDDLYIDPARVEGHHFFRVKRWEVALIVSSRLREALERAELLGLRFVPV